MNITSKVKKEKLIINFTYIAIIFSLIYLVFRYVLNFFFPFIISALITVIINPFVEIFKNRFKIKRNISAIICLCIFYIVFFSLIFFLFSISFIGIKTLVDKLPTYYDEIINLIPNFKNSEKLIDKIYYNLYSHIKTIDIAQLLTGNIGNRLINPISDIFKTLPSIILTGIISIISSVIMTLSMPQIKNLIFNQIDQKKKHLILKTKRTIFQLVKKYIKSYTFIMFITFIELSVLFIIFKIKPSILLALLISIIDILPVFGIGIILLPWAIFCFITEDLSKATILISIYLLITVIRQIIEPKIIGETLGLHPLVTLISLYVGFKLFGIIGMIILPIAIILLIDLNKKGIINLWKNPIDNAIS